MTDEQAIRDDEVRDTIKWQPRWQVHNKLDDDRDVIVFSDGEFFGLQCRNGDTTTRSLFSREAMLAIIGAVTALENRRCEAITYEWQPVTTTDSFESGEHRRGE